MFPLQNVLYTNSIKTVHYFFELQLIEHKIHRKMGERDKQFLYKPIIAICGYYFFSVADTDFVCINREKDVNKNQ